MADHSLHFPRGREQSREAVEEHNADLKARCDYLNSLGLKYLEYKSKNGTDFKVQLNEDGIFAGGEEKTLKGRAFNPNIPSEEVFTSPRRARRKGSSTRPNPFPTRDSFNREFFRPL